MIVPERNCISLESMDNTEDIFIGLMNNVVCVIVCQILNRID